MKVDVKDFRLKLYPKDFYKARDFYKNELGFKVINEWDRGVLDRGVMYQVGNTTLELLGSSKSNHSIQGADISLEVANIEQLWQTWNNKANLVFALRDNKWGDSSFCISDPEGFRITFFSKH